MSKDILTESHETPVTTRFKYVIDFTGPSFSSKYEVVVFVWIDQPDRQTWVKIGSSFVLTKWGARREARKIKNKYLHIQDSERPIETGDL